MAKVKDSLLREIDKIELGPNLALLRKTFFECKPTVEASRTQLVMQVWNELNKEEIEIRYARLLEKICQDIPISIHPGELLVGYPCRSFRGSLVATEYCSFLKGLLTEGKPESQITLGGPIQKGAISPGDWQIFAEAIRFSDGKTVEDAMRRVSESLTNGWYEDFVLSGGSMPFYQRGQPIGVPLYEKVARMGFSGICEEIEGCLRRFREGEEFDVDKWHFWQAAIIACKAAINYAKRYSQFVREEALKEKDLARQMDLYKIASVCDRVPEYPARTFHEALQSYIFTYAVAYLNTPHHPPTGWGLLDQHLYPYFKKDLEDGVLTLDKAAELIGNFLTFSARLEWVTGDQWRDYLQHQVFTSLPVGGPNRDGEDASNELTYLILHVMGLLRYAEPHIPLRWNRKTPRWLMRKALDLNIKIKGGVPQYQNSDHIVKYYCDRGVSLENARMWVGQGCSQAQPADMPNSFLTAYHNIALGVDLALHNGVASMTGKKIGVDTGDACNFRSWAELFEAFKKQCEHIIRRQIWLFKVAETERLRHFRNPFASAIMPNCVESGKDYSAGGYSHYIGWLYKDRGIVDAADSLVAVKKLCFEDKKCSMEELIKALDSNFEGRRGEEIRQLCLGAPKYGNGIDEADEMVRDVAKYTASIIVSEKNIFGWPFCINRNGIGWHFQMGKRMGALPNGRKAGEPLADASLSPMQGMDTHGPTALLRSALKADYKESLAGILNLKFPPILLGSEENREKIIDLTETFLREGGTYIQYNILDNETLREAKLHPEKYTDLVVRVAGFSAYFVGLSPEIQDELIKRTEQALG